MLKILTDVRYDRVAAGDVTPRPLSGQPLHQLHCPYVFTFPPDPVILLQTKCHIPKYHNSELYC